LFLQYTSISLFINSIVTEQIIVAVTLQICVLVVLGATWSLAIMAEVFCGFPQAFQANSEVASRLDLIRPFPVRHSSFVLSLCGLKH
jgi:hypothetical protein